MKIELQELKNNDIESFIIDNQEAFNYGALVEFGVRDEHFESDGQIISRDTILKSLNSPNARAFRVFCDNKKVGGVVLRIHKNNHNELDLFFISPKMHGLGIGTAAWNLIEKKFSNTISWITHTPYFEKRNIHFYINKLGFVITDFYCELNKDPHFNGENDEMFKMKKIMKIES